MCVVLFLFDHKNACRCYFPHTPHTSFSCISACAPAMMGFSGSFGNVLSLYATTPVYLLKAIPLKMDGCP